MTRLNNLLRGRFLLASALLLGFAGYAPAAEAKSHHVMHESKGRRAAQTRHERHAERGLHRQGDDPRSHSLRSHHDTLRPAAFRHVAFLGHGADHHGSEGLRSRHDTLRPVAFHRVAFLGHGTDHHGSDGRRSHHDTVRTVAFRPNAFHRHGIYHHAVYYRDDAAYRRHGGRHSSGPWLQCVAYASRVTGIDLSGDAYQWWENAIGRYGRGQVPVDGAVLSFRAYGRMPLGHVAVVTDTINSRKILVSQAHWPEPGMHGDISENIAVIDVSPRNDWTEVKVENGRRDTFGDAYPTDGFIYPYGRGPQLAEAGEAAAYSRKPGDWRQSVQFASALPVGAPIATSAPDRAIR